MSVSEAFIVKHKTAIIGFVAGVIILVAGALAYKHLYAEPREEKAQAAIFKGQEYFEHRITSYNVCYTKLLRRLGHHSSCT